MQLLKMLSSFVFAKNHFDLIFKSKYFIYNESL